MENNTYPQLRNFLEISYDELEKMNLKLRSEAKTQEISVIEAKIVKYLTGEDKIKAITICFSDIEGRLHMLDYNKNYFLKSISNLTFDGSSVRGFSSVEESSLKLQIDWTSFIHLPSDVFGPGKVMIFAFVLNPDGSYHHSDFRGQLKNYLEEIKKEQNITPNIAFEIEGFLMEGINAESSYDKKIGFKLVANGGYYHTLPLDSLRIFIDRAAEAQRAMGFQNEKDHCEVAPSQFELNFGYEEAIQACDQAQLYKLVCRQIAANMNMTASFLPKPIAAINGNGMHVNISFSKNGKNILYNKNGKDSLSDMAWDGIYKILNHAPELSLIYNSSVNAYRRLDPGFISPNQIKVSAVDRSSMIRISGSDEDTTRFEIRSVAPDANPYMTIFATLKTFFGGEKLKINIDKRERARFLPGTIIDAMKAFKTSTLINEIIQFEALEEYLNYKRAAADRSARKLGTSVKNSEVLFHHEVTNQTLWNQF